MNQEKLNRIVTLHYDKWLNYSRKLAFSFNLEDEAADILNQVLCDILAKNQRTPIPITTKCKNEEESILCYISKTIKRNIVSPSTPYRQQYQRTRAALNLNADVTQLSVPDTPAEDTNVQDIIWDIFEHLNIRENDRQLFKFYYSEQHCLKQWPGKESPSSISRKCQRICKMIKAQIRLLYKDMKVSQ